MIEGRVDVKTGRVKPRTPFMKQEMEDTGINTCVELKRG